MKLTKTKENTGNTVSFLFRLFILILLFNNALTAQDCKCVNCPGNIKIANGVTGEPSVQEFLYFVNGAVSNDLADPFQGVCGVTLNFKSDNVYQLKIYLISPEGDTVTLVGPDVGPGNQSNFAMWNVLFYPNSIVPTPDPGYSPQWTNYDDWQFFGDYQGSYHPSSGKLEDFNKGSVNGPWRLVVENSAELNTGKLLDFSIIFCDETGIDCGCLAYAGLFPSFQSIQACPGSDKLIIKSSPAFNGYKPDTTLYDYTYIVAGANNTIIEFDSLPDLTAYPAGNYKVCGFSFLATDSLKIPDANGIIKLDSIYKEISSSDPDYCADLTKNCTYVDILATPPPYQIKQVLCKDSCLVINNVSYCDPGDFMLSFIDKNGCDSIVNLTLIEGLPTSSTISDTICKGEFAILGNNFYGTTGTFVEHLISSTGCDSTVTLKLQVLNIDVDILEPDTLNCSNPSVLLDGLEKNGNNGIINYKWTASNGGIVNGAGKTQDLNVNVPGTYMLTGTFNGVNGKSCSDSKSVNVVENKSLPEITSIPDQFLCLGGELDLSKLGIKDLNGLGGSFTYHSALPATPGNKINPLVSPVVNTSYYVLYKAGSCQDTKEIIVFVNDNPLATLKDYVSVCNSNVSGQNTQIKFDTLIVSGDKTGFWVDMQMPPVGTGTFPIIDFNGVTPGTYQYAYVTQSAIPPCEDSTYIVNIIVENCQCPSVAILSPGDICNNTQTIDLKTLEVTTNTGTWTLSKQPLGGSAFVTGNTLTINNTIAGNYILQFTLNQTPPPGCPKSATVDFAISVPPMAIVKSAITVCNADDKGQPTTLDFSTLVTGGDLGGTWKDVNGSSATGVFPILNFKGVPTGAYTFRYTTNSAVSPCDEVSYDVIVTVLNCKCPIVAFNQVKVCIENDTLDLNTILTFPTAGTWSMLSTPGGSNPAVLTGSILISNNNDPGKYVLVFTLDSPLPGCPSFVTTPIDVVLPPSAIVDSLLTICNSNTNGHISTVDLTSLLKGGTVTGKWEKITFSNASGVLPMQDFNGVTPGSYYYKYTTDSGNQPCNEAEYIVRVLVEDCECPSVSIISPGSFCNDNASVDLNLYKITAESGSWSITSTPPGSNPGTISNNVFNGTNSDPGTYGIQFTIDKSVQGCPVYSQTSIQLYGINAADLDSSKTVCNVIKSGGQSTLVDFNTLIESGNSTGTWKDISGSGAAGNFPVLDFTGVTPGDYTFEYTIPANGPCPSVTYNIIIEVLNCNCDDIFTLNPGIICNNLDSLDLGLYSGASASLTVSSVPAGQDPNILNQKVLSVKDKLPGTYIITGSLLSQPAGCPLTEDISIQIYDFKSSGTGGAQFSFCEGSDTLINLLDLITGEEGGGTWLIKPGISSGFNTTTGELNTSLLTTGNYSFQYIQYNQLPCAVDSNNISVVNILPVPVADAGQDQQLACTNKQVTLGGSGNGNLQNVSFFWTGPNLSSVFDPNPVSDSSGTYYLLLTNTTTGCSDIDNVEVTGSASNLITADIDIVNPDCKVKTGSFVANASGGIAPYLYSLNGAVLQSGNSFNKLDPGNYNLLVQDAFGCDWETNVTIDALSDNLLSLGPDTTIFFGDSLQLIPVTTISANEIDSLIWSSSGYLSCTECFETFVKPFKSTLYTFTIFTKQGCELSAEKIVHVLKDIKIFVPNIFSPNGDGINDKIEVFSDNNVSIIDEFMVFSRWGEKLYEVYNVDPSSSSLAWDGKFRGRKMNPGVYVYYLTAHLIDGSIFTVKGDITILK